MTSLVKLRSRVNPWIAGIMLGAALAGGMCLAGAEADAGRGRLRLTGIEAGRSGQAPWVKITTTGRPTFTQRTLDNPYRLLVILQGTELARLRLPGPDQAPPLRRVRAAQHDQDAWVVLDLADDAPWSIQPSAKGLLLQPASAAKNAQATVAAARQKPSLLVAEPVVAAAYQVVDIQTENLGEKTRATITTDGLARYRVRSTKQGRELVLQIYGAGLSGQLSVPGLPAGVIDHVAVRQEAVDSEPVVEIGIRLAQAAAYVVAREQNQILVDFNNLGPAGAAPGRGNLNALISVDFENAQLESVLRALAQQAGFDLIMSPGSQNKAGSAVTVSITDQPLQQVLDYVLRPLGLSYVQNTNTLRVGLASEFPAETLVFTLRNLDVKSAAMKSSVEAAFTPGARAEVVVDENANRVIVSAIPGDMARVKEIIATMDTQRRLATRTLPLRYAQAKKIAAIVQPLLSSLGTVKVDEGKNALVVSDIPGYLEKVKGLADRLDVRDQQVMIEARIVEIFLSSEDDLGVRWNRKGKPGDRLQPTAGSDAPGTIQVGTMDGKKDWTAALTSMEAKGLANTISNPRVATLNNHPATIQASQNIPYATSHVSNGVVSSGVKYLELPLVLNVTPQVAQDQVMLNPLTLTVTTVLGDQNPPVTATRSATTQMLVNDGETVVLGGLIREEERSQPVPLLFGLFTGKTIVKNKVELVVFLTPHILK